MFPYFQYISKYNQQDAALHNSFIYVKCSTCFRRYLRPSSGAQKLYIQHRVLVKTLLLPAAIVEEMETMNFKNKNVLVSSCKVPDILFDFNQIWGFLDRSPPSKKSLRYQISPKHVQLEPKMRTDRRTDVTNNRSFSLARKRLKI
jgi:hypothetical protein